MPTVPYGTAPHLLNDFLRSLSADEARAVHQLDLQTNSLYETEGLRRFRLTSTGVIDWSDVPIADQDFADDEETAARVFTRWAHAHFPASGDVIVFWGNFVIPSIRLPLATALDHGPALFEVCDELWIFSADAKIIVERYHEGRMTIAAVPPEPR
jgi:hypothetical protein